MRVFDKESDEYKLIVKQTNETNNENINNLEKDVKNLTEEIRKHTEKKDSILQKIEELAQQKIEELNKEIEELSQKIKKDTKEKDSIIEKIKELNQKEISYHKEIKEIKDLINSLPKSLKESLVALVDRSQSKVATFETTEKDINQLRKEIELWFDRSMERASGVYKRNAKGVAILIGFLVAIVVNADTFYMIRRLSTDTNLRNTITKNADLANTNCSNTASTDKDKNTDLNCVRTKTKAVLEEVPLPIGWVSNNLTDQWSFPVEIDVDSNRPQQWDVFGFNAQKIRNRLYPQYSDDRKSSKSKIDWPIWLLFHLLLPIIFFGFLISWGIKIWNSKKQNYLLFLLLSIVTACLIIFTGLKVIFGVLLGWGISAVAISMGASFWFDLIGKFINIRNTGPKPVSSTKDKIVSNDNTLAKK
ncbi:hypothetical protein [Nostoc sp. LEGE 12450]|uniref:hypothetical protein n=1 Tax=Nostoc sp. LEGE 12450 TaxID=1828643 RepID=UPI001882D988|nr:hypothetical protein [Nostoc sp. LEGE 12450]MBE8990109.1 hypothetical protein [Nostoc sp. LEGE 12450]